MASENSKSVVVKLDAHLTDALDKICEEWGIRSRADLIEKILKEVLASDASKCQPPETKFPQSLQDGH